MPKQQDATPQFTFLAKIRATFHRIRSFFQQKFQAKKAEDSDQVAIEFGWGSARYDSDVDAVSDDGGEILQTLADQVEQGKLDLAAAVEQGVLLLSNYPSDYLSLDWQFFAENLQEVEDRASYVTLAELFYQVAQRLSAHEVTAYAYQTVLLTRGAQAMQLRERREFAQVFHVYEQMIAVAKEHEDDRWQVASWMMMGDVCRLQLPALAHHNRFTDAERYYRQALALCEQTTLEPTQRADILLELGKTLDHQGRAQEASQYLEECLVIRRKYHSWQSTELYACLVVLAGVYHHAAEYSAASNCIREAIELAPDNEKRASLLSELCHVLGYLDNENAGEMITQAVQLVDRLATQSKVHELRSDIYAHLGGYRMHIGDLQGALDAYQIAYEEAKGVGDKEAEGRCLNSLSQLYLMLGQEKVANSKFQTARIIHWELDDHQAQAHSHAFYGGALIDKGDLSIAVYHLANAYVLYHEIQQPANMGLVAITLAQVHQKMGKLNLAKACIRYGLAKTETSNTVRHQCIAWGVLAQIQTEEGQIDAALKSYAKSISFAQQVNDRQNEAHLRFERGRLLQMQSSISEEAEADFRQAIDLIENIRGGLRATDQRIQFQWKGTEAYMHLVCLLSQQADRSGKLSEAYSFAERSRSRAFAELLSRTRVRHPNSLSQALADREAELLRQLSHLEASEQQGITPAQQHTKLNDELKVVWNQMVAIDDNCRNYVDLRRIPVVNLTEITQLLQN